MPAGKPSSFGRYLPIGYAVSAVLIAAVLLPTVLRPPQDQQSATAAFSPDAPPDDAPPEALLQTLRQASSSTAGRAVREVSTADQVILEEGAPPPPPPPPPKRAARGRCFGDPPRTTESVYSTLCVPAFTGDNGGATWKGVSGDEIKVGLVLEEQDGVPAGRLEPTISPADTEDARIYKVWQQYFNERFEFYRRRLQFYVYHEGEQADGERATVDQMASEQVFASYGSGAAGAEHAVKKQIIELSTSNGPVDFYGDHHPYAYNFYADSWTLRHLTMELACKQWVGRPLGENNLNERMDVTFDYAGPRKWGLISYQDQTRSGATEMYKRLMAACGGEFVQTAEYNLTDNAQSIAGTVSKMKAAGVTTIVAAIDPLTPAVITNEATRLQYFPEWVHAGTGGIDTPGAGRLMDDTQANHIVGISGLEIPRVDQEKDWYRAYKEVDPEGEPDFPVFYRQMLLLAGGIQHAGPNLTPETFWTGLKKWPYREPDPVWSMGGGFRERDQFTDIGNGKYGDYTYIDYVALQWFDNKGDDPNSSSTGTWRYPFSGKRFKLGELPSEPVPWFTDGITTPERGVAG